MLCPSAFKICCARTQSKSQLLIGLLLFTGTTFYFMNYLLLHNRFRKDFEKVIIDKKNYYSSGEQVPKIMKSGEYMLNILKTFQWPIWRLFL